MSVSAVSDADFATRVLSADHPVLVDVWAAWCAPCKALEPVVARLAESYAGRAEVLALDADANVETVTRYDVRALPSLLLFDRGVIVERLTGAQSLSRLTAMLDQQLSAREHGVAPVAAPIVVPRAPDQGAVAEAQALAAAAEATVVFKHSATCSISIAVKREYDAFVAAHPQVPTRLLVVQQERPLSNALESVLRVQHESPQALVVRDGRVLWHASHRRITASALDMAVRLAKPTA
jgi:thioredoxin 1